MTKRPAPKHPTPWYHVDEMDDDGREITGRTVISDADDKTVCVVEEVETAMQIIMAVDGVMADRKADAKGYTKGLEAAVVAVESKASGSLDESEWDTALILATEAIRALKPPAPEPTKESTGD